MARYRPHDIRNLTETDDRQFITGDQKSKVDGLGTVYRKSRAPTVNDDETEGYEAGDTWFDTAGKTFYRLVDASEDNAVWEESTLTAAEAESIAQGEVGSHESDYNHDNLPTSTEKIRIGNLPADTQAELVAKVALDAGNFTIVDRDGTASDRGARLKTAIDNAVDGQVIVVHAGLDYNMSADATLGGTGINPHLIALGASDDLKANLTGNSVVVDTTGLTKGIRWNDSTNDAGFNNGSMPVAFSQGTDDTTKAGTIKYSESGGYTTSDWDGKECAYDIDTCTIGNNFCRYGTMAGNVYGTCTIGSFSCEDGTFSGNIYGNCVIGFYFCGEGTMSGNIYGNCVIGSNFCFFGAMSGNIYGSVFTGDTAADLISQLGEGGSYVNCVDSDGILVNSQEHYNVKVQEYVQQAPMSSDPPDPDDGYSRQWVSDGTGSGDAGDVMIKINIGGTVKTITLIDYSAQ